jgi:hypothetical protein
MRLTAFLAAQRDIVTRRAARNVQGIGLMIGLGLLLSWYSGGGRLPVRPRSATVGST